MHEPKQTVLGQRYRLIRQLDAGGMGSVWEAEAVQLSSLVAVKIMDRALTATPEAAQRFLREACTAASLRSPHVVQILDYGVHDGTPFIAMELLEGESLAARLEREGRLGSWEQTELVVRHVARALGRAHDAGVIHRDLKPANIFLVRDEEEEIVKLLDFGIVKTTGPERSPALTSKTRTGEFLGSPAYASPEQLQGSRDLDHRADIWSLGVISYECLLGRLPFGSDSFVGLLLEIVTGPLPVPSEQGPVPAGFDAWFARACARDAELRFQSVREAAADLKRLVRAAKGAGPPSSDVDARSLPGVERALAAASESAGAAASKSATATPARSARPDTVLHAVPRAPSIAPTQEMTVVRTEAMRVVAPESRLGRHRWVTVLLTALTLPAAGALAFFTPGASTLHGALERQRLGLAVDPSSQRTSGDAPASGDVPPPLDARELNGSPGPRVAVMFDAPAALGSPALSVAPDAGGAPDLSAIAELAPVLVERPSRASGPIASPPAPSRSDPLRKAPVSSAATSRSARLTITASVASDVMLDGVPLGTTPLESVRVEPGVHDVTFIHDGQRSVESLTIRRGEHKYVEARFSAPSGNGLDEAAVKATIKRHRSAVIDTCWDDAFGTRGPGAPTSVRVPITITVEPSGGVKSVVAAAEPAASPDLCRCIEQRVSAWRFPGARAETVVSVAFVFVLK